jgi:uncharacterized SAM-binding protein YcdF (DUF218 family)
MTDIHRRSGVASAIVVLGCRLLPDGTLSSAGRRRVQRGLEAYAAGVAPVVIVTGGPRWGGVREADAMREALLAAEVPEGHVIAEPRARSTRENAYYTARLPELGGARTVAVVTCAWHLPRAVRNFRAAGLDPIGLPARPPAAGPLTRTRRRVHEIVSSCLDAVAWRVG